MLFGFIPYYIDVTQVETDFYHVGVTHPVRGSFAPALKHRILNPEYSAAHENKAYNSLGPARFLSEPKSGVQALVVTMILHSQLLHRD